MPKTLPVTEVSSSFEYSFFRKLTLAREFDVNRMIVYRYERRSP